MTQDFRVSAVQLAEFSDVDHRAVNLLPQDQDLKPPQPLILDPSLRFPLNSRILKAWTDHQHVHPSDRGDAIIRQPWILCGDNVEPGRIEQVEEAGAKVIAVPLDADGQSHISVIAGDIRIS